jgi:hypothetical protein
LIIIASPRARQNKLSDNFSIVSKPAVKKVSRRIPPRIGYAIGSPKILGKPECLRL